MGEGGWVWVANLGLGFVLCAFVCFYALPAAPSNCLLLCASEESDGASSAPPGNHWHTGTWHCSAVVEVFIRLMKVVVK